MNALARIAKEMQDRQRLEGDRAYQRLCTYATEGGELNLSDHQLVMAINRALWARELPTVQLGLNELEVRTAADAVAMAERRAAA